MIKEEYRHTYTYASQTLLGPRLDFCRHFDFPFFEWNLRIRIVKMDVWRNDAALENVDRLDKSRKTSC